MKKIDEYQLSPQDRIRHSEKHAKKCQVLHPLFASMKHQS